MTVTSISPVSNSIVSVDVANGTNVTSLPITVVSLAASTETLSSPASPMLLSQTSSSSSTLQSSPTRGVLLAPYVKKQKISRMKNKSNENDNDIENKNESNVRDDDENNNARSYTSQVLHNRFNRGNRCSYKNEIKEKLVAYVPSSSLRCIDNNSAKIVSDTTRTKQSSVIGGETLNERLYNVCRSIVPIDARTISNNRILFANEESETDDFSADTCEYNRNITCHKRKHDNGNDAKYIDIEVTSGHEKGSTAHVRNEMLLENEKNEKNYNVHDTTATKTAEKNDKKIYKNVSVKYKRRVLLTEPAYVESSLFVARLNNLLIENMKHEKVTLGGPSAVGKTTLLNAIDKNCPFADVSRISFEEIYHAYDQNHEEAARYLLTKRVDAKIYEHTNECVLIYPVVHRYMNSTKNIHNLRKCYEECLKLLTEVSDTRMLILLDFTEAFHARYFKRLTDSYNDIDYNDDWYLYLQLAAFLSIVNNHNLFPAMRVIIALDRDTKKNDTISTDNESVAGHVSGILGHKIHDDFASFFETNINKLTIPRVNALTPLETLPKTFLHIIDGSLLDKMDTLINVLLQMHIVDERGTY